MKFETNQHLKLGHQLRLAPRIIQAMEILQLPLPALEEKIEQEIESNIALELVEPDPEDLPNEEHLSDVEFSNTDEYDDATVADLNDSPKIQPAPRGDREFKFDAIANIRARKESLFEQLQHQWTFADVPDEILKTGNMLIEHIDVNGFLTIPESELKDELKKEFNYETTSEQIRETISSLQKWLDPPGIAARSLQESLLIQVDTYRLDDPDAWDDVYALIDDHLDDILENRLPKIASKTGFELTRIKDAIEKMHELTLSPGKFLATDHILPVIPDAVIEFDDKQGKYIVGIRDGNLPLIRISKQYIKLSKEKSTDEEAIHFIQRNINAARWIIEAVSQRKTTLQRVVQVVTNRQRDFLDKGDSFLRPLPMVEVADMLGIHVATVSRAVADKWVQTPRGIFPLRRFFSGGTRSQSDGDMSWEAVKTRLQEIVHDEDSFKPLSDEGIARKLREQGIDIARRTVVKYRQQLDIPAARLRKQF